MKMGTTVTFLIGCLIALGFLLSDTLQTHEKVAQLESQVAQLSAERDALQGQNAQLAQEAETLRRERDALKERVTQAAAQQQAKQAELESLTQACIAIEQARQQAVNDAAGLRQQISWMEQQQNALSGGIPVTDRSAATQVLTGAALVFPVLPAAIAATLYLKRGGKTKK